MDDKTYELTTEDLVIEEPAPRGRLPTAQSGTSVSVKSASATESSSGAPARPRFVPSALSRPIKERSRSKVPERAAEGMSSLASKAASFFEQALEAERAGDASAAIRHVKLAITFNPTDPRYQELLNKLAR